jgi:hypothetical protein
MDKARAEDRIVLTSDLDFGELLALSRAGLPSVIVFRLKDMRPESVQRHLAQVRPNLAAELERGAIVSAIERRCRVHVLPMGKGRATEKVPPAGMGTESITSRSLCPLCLVCCV